MAKPGQAETEGWYVKDKLPSKWIRIDLQPRDLKLLRLLLEQKFLSGSQITRYLFQNKTRYAYLRLWKLRRFGLVRRLWLGVITFGNAGLKVVGE